MPKTVQLFRCESDLRLYPADFMIQHAGEHICLSCWAAKITANMAKQGLKGGAEHGKKDPKFMSPPVSVPGVGTPKQVESDIDELGFGWFAVAHTGSDSKVKKAIFARAKAHGQGHMVKKVMIPKVKTTRVTKDRWAAYDADGKELGHVTATDHDEAVFKAKEEFAKKKGWAYKPSEEDLKNEVFHTLEKVKEGKRTVYLAKAESGRLLGKIRSTKNESQARKVATNLYGRPKKPRPDQMPRVEVAKVEKVKDGGIPYTQNQRAIPGYLLVKCKEDDDLHDTIKRTPGVYSMLPFTEKMDYEEWEDKMEEGEPVPKPVPIPQEQIERLEARYKERVTHDLKEGDRIQVKDGAYTGLFGSVVQVYEDEFDPRVQVRLEFMGQPIDVTLHALHVRK